MQCNAMHSLIAIAQLLELCVFSSVLNALNLPLASSSTSARREAVKLTEVFTTPLFIQWAII